MDGPFLKKLEHIVDLLIPYALVFLIGILVIEFTKPEVFVEYPAVEYIDMLIVAIFVFDLAFKFHHSKTVPFFLKTYWLEIIAVFPFFLIFRLLDGLGLLTFAIGETAIREGQGIVHAGEIATKEAETVAKTISNAEKEVVAIGKTVGNIEREAVAIGRSIGTFEREAAGVVRITRAQRLMRFIRPIFDSRKTIHAVKFYEHPLHRITKK